MYTEAQTQTYGLTIQSSKWHKAPQTVTSRGLYGYGFSQETCA